MATKITYHFWIKVDSPAGWMAVEGSIPAEFETDDHDHAIELAERYWDSIKPAGYIDETLVIA